MDALREDLRSTIFLHSDSHSSLDSKCELAPPKNNVPRTMPDAIIRGFNNSLLLVSLFISVQHFHQFYRFSLI